MNHGIRIVRHSEKASGSSKEVPGVLHASGLSTASDEEIIAGILCTRLHDDETSSGLAKACHTIHFWPPLPPGKQWAKKMLDPDPQCVIKRTAALRRWNGANTSRSHTAKC